MIHLVLLYPITHGRFRQVQLPSHLPDAAVMPQAESHRLLLERLGEPSSLPCTHEHLPAHSRAFFGVHKTQGRSDTAPPPERAHDGRAAIHSAATTVPKNGLRQLFTGSSPLSL